MGVKRSLCNWNHVSREIDVQFSIFTLQDVKNYALWKNLAICCRRTFQLTGTRNVRRVVLWPGLIITVQRMITYFHLVLIFYWTAISIFSTHC
jgi:hypothetical protein